MTKTEVLDVMEITMLSRLRTNCLMMMVHSPELNRKMTRVLHADAATVTLTVVLGQKQEFFQVYKKTELAREEY